MGTDDKAYGQKLKYCSAADAAAVSDALTEIHILDEVDDNDASTCVGDGEGHALRKQAPPFDASCY